MNKQTTWHVRDIILLALIGIIFGAIFEGAALLYNPLEVALTPFGLAPLANELLLGPWIMAGPLAAYLLRLPGAGVLGELLAAAGEILFGGQWGASTFISGLIQGVPAELGFTVTGYKHYNWLSLTLSNVFTALVTYAWDLFKNGYAEFGFGQNLLFFVVRCVSMLIFGGVLVKLITDLLDRSGVLQRR